jgi:hypothetical protein
LAGLAAGGVLAGLAKTLLSKSLLATGERSVYCFWQAHCSGSAALPIDCRSPCFFIVIVIIIINDGDVLDRTEPAQLGARPGPGALCKDCRRGPLLRLPERVSHSSAAELLSELSNTFVVGVF